MCPPGSGFVGSVARAVASVLLARVVLGPGAVLVRFLLLPLGLMLIAAGPLAGIAHGDEHPVTAETSVHLPADGVAAPTILLIHGWETAPSFYQRFTEDLVKRGFAVAHHHSPVRSETDPSRWSPAVSRSIDDLERATQDHRSPLYGRVEIGTLALVGHSLGGAVAIDVASSDPRVRGLVAIAPGTHVTHREQLLERASAISRPTLVLGGARDAVVPPDRFARRIAEACSSAGTCRYYEVPHGDHESLITGEASDYVPMHTPLDFMLYAFSPRPAIDSEAHEGARAFVVGATLDFLRSHVGAGASPDDPAARGFPARRGPATGRSRARRQGLQGGGRGRTKRPNTRRPNTRRASRASAHR